MAVQETSLTAEHVESVFLDCLFKDISDIGPMVRVEGIVQTVALDHERTEAHRQEIHDMLAELPDKFKTSAGGGYSFLGASVDRHGNLWTGMHQRMEQLFILGIAIGEVEYCLPRDLWTVFPSNIPYLKVNQ